MVAQLVEPPVAEHPRMQEILVDRRQFVGERHVQVPQDILVAFHCIISGRLAVMDQGASS